MRKDLSAKRKVNYLQGHAIKITWNRNCQIFNFYNFFLFEHNLALYNVMKKGVPLNKKLTQRNSERLIITIIEKNTSN